MSVRTLIRNIAPWCQKTEGFRRDMFLFAFEPRGLALCGRWRAAGIGKAGPLGQWHV
jgi:hypothetical protein